MAYQAEIIASGNYKLNPDVYWTSASSTAFGAAVQTLYMSGDLDLSLIHIYRAGPEHLVHQGLPLRAGVRADRTNWSPPPAADFARGLGLPRPDGNPSKRAGGGQITY